MQTVEKISLRDKITESPDLTILGAGPAGLACAYFARKKNWPVTIYEASPFVGGNCRTLRFGDFLFDTGAHRFHDRFPEITDEIKKILNDDLTEISSPSQIVYKNRFIDFPLSPLNLLSNLGPLTTFSAMLSFATARLSRTKDDSFESIAVKNYGRTLAKAFLLDYSEKLWGVPSLQLSPSVSGKRLKGLHLSTFLIETFRGSNSKTQHLDGRFYYPRLGIGMIMDKLADACNRENIKLNSRVTGIFHADNRIHSIGINKHEIVSVENVVSTLPLNILLQILNPAPPQQILDIAKSIRFQNIILVALFLNREQITRNASLYFADKEILFTRAYEPKNRSASMAPEKLTSLIVEIPSNPQNPVWSMDESKLIENVVEQLSQKKLIRSSDVFESAVYRIPFAYPVLELGIESRIQEIMNYLDKFQNLKIAGRSGRFTYTHIHDLMAAGRETIEELSIRQASVK